MENVDRLPGSRPTTGLLLVTTFESEPVSFTVTTADFGTTPHTARPGESTRIEFPSDSLYVRDSRRRDGYVRIEAEQGKTISVYGVNDEQRSTDGFVALSCDGMDLGIPFRRYEYAIASGDIRATGSTLERFSEFLIIPCEDDTEVEIVPSQVVSVTANDFATPRFGKEISPSSALWQTPDGMRPNAGETLLIAHSNDLTGTIIRSNKPVVVLSGHQCAQVPVGNTACDHMVEQIPPQTTWGYTFLMNPLGARESGDTYRVVTVYDDTEVSVTCADEGSGDNVVTKKLGILNRTPGDNWLEYSTSEPNTRPCVKPFIRRFCSIETTKPVLVVQYSQGYTVDSPCTSLEQGAQELGDPFMSVVPPVVQYINNYLVSSIRAIAGTFPTRFVSVAVYKDFFQPSQIMFDDSPLESDSSRWNKIFCLDGEVCGYGIYKSLGTGDHRVYHTNDNAGLSVQTYGFQQQNSYGFPAGMEMEQLSGKYF